MKTKRIKNIVLKAVFIFIFLCVPLYSDPKTISLININDTCGKYMIGKNIELYADKEKKFNIDDIIKDSNALNPKILWKRSNSNVPPIGFSSYRYWVRFAVKNESKKKQLWNLVQEYPLIDNIWFYTITENHKYSVQRAGDHFPFSQREIPYRNFVFRLNSNPNEQTHYYMCIESTSSVNIQLIIISRIELIKKISNEQMLLGLYYGLLIVMAFYNFFIFISIRDKSYLYYIIWILGYGMYQLTLNGLAFQYFWPNHIWWGNNSLPFFTFVGASAGLQFVRSFLKTDENLPVMDKIILGLIIIQFMGLLLTFFLPYSVVMKFGTAIIIPMTIFTIIVGIISLMKGIRAVRFFLMASSALFIGITVYALKTLGLLPSNFVTDWSQQFASALEVTLFSLALADRINVIKHERKIAQTEKNNVQEKYRALFEGSKDTIFTMDEKWNITSVNKAIQSQFHLKPEDVISKNLMDFIYQYEDEDGLTKKTIQEKLEIFAMERMPISFKTQFKLPISQEPIDIRIDLEYIKISGKDEVMGKASTIVEDTLIQYFEYEKQRLSIGNYLSTTEEISYRVTRNLSKYMDSRDIALIRIALREIIINSIEHGNLNISYEEKTKAMMNNKYFELLTQRQNDPQYAAKKIEILYSIDPEKVIYKITDQGKGFDYKKILEDSSKSANESLLTHGRGITLSKNIFDKIQFNKRGNQVLLVKRFRKDGRPLL